MNTELELLSKIVGGICMLLLPVAALGFISHYSSMAAAGRVGREYCTANDYEFVGIEIKKANYTLKYRYAGKLVHQKFRMAHLFGRVLRIEWLK
jgi:hypothetical protein